MKASLIRTVSLVALLATSQQALAKDQFTRATGTQRAAAAMVPKPAAATLPVKFKSTLKSSAASPSRTSDAFSGAAANRTKGVGVPGGLGGSPKGSFDVGSIKGSMGQAKGRGTSEGATVKQAAEMKKEIGEVAASRGKEKGVGANDGVSAKQARVVKAGIDEAATSRGKEKGIESGGASFKLSKQQVQAMKDSNIQPKVNPYLAGKDDDKGGKAGGKTGGGKTGGTATPKPAGSGGKTGSTVNPKTGGSGKGGGTAGTHKPYPTGAKVSNGGKLIVFPNQKGPGKNWPTPPKPKSLSATAVTPK